MWITSYGKAWETGDKDLIASLFTEDATYRSSPFREPYRGHQEIRAYWERSAGSQRGTRVAIHFPVGEPDGLAGASPIRCSITNGSMRRGCWR